MSVTFHYKISKANISSKLDIPDGTQLKEIKEMVLHIFWQKYKQSFPKSKNPHGHIDYILLQNEKGEIITNEDMLRGIEHIQVIFQNMPLPHPWFS